MKQQDFEYEQNNIEFNNYYPKETGGGIKCKNYELCNCVLPKCCFKYKNNYLCVHCENISGTRENLIDNFKQDGKGVLEFINNVDCPICLEKKRGVSQPRCDHFACIDCFKRCYFGDEDESERPIFPYPEIEDYYYYNGIKNQEEMEREYPFIRLYKIKDCIWEDKRLEKYAKEKYLRKCPLCCK